MSFGFVYILLQMKSRHAINTWLDNTGEFERSRSRRVGHVTGRGTAQVFFLTFVNNMATDGLALLVD